MFVGLPPYFLFSSNFRKNIELETVMNASTIYTHNIKPHPQYNLSVANITPHSFFLRIILFNMPKFAHQQWLAVTTMGGNLGI